MNKTTFEQHRTGEFHAHVIPRGQCGFSVGQQRFEYELTIVAYEDGLDDNGWLMDNRDADRLFDKWREGTWQASCEDLAAGGVCMALDALGDRAEYIECAVKPNRNATLRCKWRRGDDRPQWVPKAVETGVPDTHDAHDFM